MNSNLIRFKVDKLIWRFPKIVFSKMKRSKYLALIFLGLFTSCWWLNPKYPKAYFPSEVTNFEILNTSSDDYNMDIRILFHQMDLIFSSNRNSIDERQFDLIGEQVSFSWDQEEGDFDFGITGSNMGNELVEKLANSTKTEFNERGPYTFGFIEDVSYLLFSRDDDGDFTIHSKKFQISNSVSTEQKIFEEEESFRVLSERGNEMYPSFYGEKFQKEYQGLASVNDPEKLILTSDFEGVFNIYEVELPEDQDVMAFLISGSLKIGEKLQINSDENDHAPFINKSRMVFASDRKGGYGGYDLYFSDFDGSTWSQPQNFGPEINTEFDEFRPVIDIAPYFKNSIMIFSSNRPGGLGGFDLYFVGIPKF